MSTGEYAPDSRPAYPTRRADRANPRRASLRRVPRRKRRNRAVRHRTAARSPAARSPQPRPGGPNRGGPNRAGDRPNRSDKPYNQGGMPPVMNFEAKQAQQPRTRQAHRGRTRRGDGRLRRDSMTVAQAETVQKPGAPGAAGGRKTGVVVSVHGNDVFVEVPGGRSQGVLPLQQFEGRKPVVGESVEFDIDHYDAANGLLILTREGSTQVVHDWSGIVYGMVVESPRHRHEQEQDRPDH